MSDPRLRTHADADAWADAAAARLAGALTATLAARETAVLAVCGGTTPAPIFARLGASPLDWDRVTVTLTDERWVPEESPDSNARLVRETLLVGLSAAARFAPLRGEAAAPEAAALAVSERLAVAGAPDVVLLGMGEDGHIASIFPGCPRAPALLNCQGAPACLAVPAGEGRPPPQPRLSLNLSALSRGSVTLAVRGAAKRRLVETGGAEPIAALLACAGDLRILWTE